MSFRGDIVDYGKGKFERSTKYSQYGGLESPVRMKTSGHHEEVKTDNQGSFSVGFTHPPFNVDLVLTVSKDGYKTFEKSFRARDAKDFPSTIVMEAAQSAGQSK